MIEDIKRLPSQERPVLLSALTKRGEAVLRFAYVINEMQALRPDHKGSSFATEPTDAEIAGFKLFIIPIILMLCLWKWSCVSTKTMAKFTIPALLLFTLTILSRPRNVSNSFEDDAKIAINRAIFNHGLPPKDLPSAQKFTEAFTESQLKLTSLAPPPSSHSSRCDLLNRPGMHSRYILTRWCFAVRLIVRAEFLDEELVRIQNDYPLLLGEKTKAKKINSQVV